MANKVNSSLFVEHLRKSGITCLYHFTSRRNLESIKRQGGLYSWWYMHQHGITIFRWSRIRDEKFRGIGQFDLFAAH